MFTTDKLDNGLRIATKKLDGYRSVALGVWIKAGSVNERDNEAGISHFIEHMLFKGTKTRSAKEIAVLNDAIGGNLNAFTSKECTCGYTKTLENDVDTAADIISDMLLNSLFDEEELEREKGVVIEEILMNEDSPEDVAHEKLSSIFFEGSALAKPIMGTKESVSSFTPEMLRAYMERMYRAENMVIACAGDFDRERLMKTLGDRFSGVPSGSADGFTGGKLTEKSRFEAVEKDIEQMHICLGLPGYSIGQKEQYAIAILSNALGGNSSSRLFQRVREQLGLAYSVYSYSSSYCDTGYLTIYAGTGEKQAESVIKTILDEIDRLKHHGLTESEFNRCKQQLKIAYILGMENSSAHSSSIGKALLLRGKALSTDEVLARMEAITIDDVNNIIPHVLDTDRLCGAYVGKNSGRLVNLLR